MMQIPPEILFTTSTIADGNMSFKFGEEVEVVQNREAFCKQIGIDYANAICMRCDHGSVISNVNITNYTANQGAKNPQAMIESEVLVTQEPGLTLMLLTADCLPSAFYDPVTKTIALAHFSRETIADGLPTDVVQHLVLNNEVEPANLQVFVGPHIKPESYCFPTPLREVKPRIEKHVVESSNNTCIDLPAAHTAQLAAAGVPEANIHYSEIDTFASPEHFSHFESIRDDQKPHGRLATILVLAAQET